MVGIPVLSGKILGNLKVDNSGGGGVTTEAALTSFNQISLSTQGGTGALLLGGSVGSTKSTEILLASGTTITTASNSDTVTGNLVTLSASGNIAGSGTGALTISAPFIGSVNAGGNVNLLDKVSVTIEQDCNVVGNFSLNGAKNILVPTAILTGESSLTLTSTGVVAGTSTGTSPASISTTDLITNGAGTFNLSNSAPVNLDLGSATASTGANKSLTLTSTVPVQVIGNIGSTSAIISLSTTGGQNIDTSATAVVSGKTLTLSAGGTGAQIGDSLMTVNAATLNASADTLLSVVETAATGTLKNLTATDGNINVQSGGKSAVLQTFATTGTGKTFVPGAAITATNGSITIQSNNATKGSIVIGKGSNLATAGTGGPVKILIGPEPNPEVQGTAPVGVTLNPSASFFFFNSGITVSGTKSTLPTIELVSKGGGQIFFSTGNLKATAIKINGNTNASPTMITADPPVIQGAPGQAGAGSGGGPMVTFTDGSITIPSSSTIAAPQILLAPGAGAAGSIVRPTDSSSVNAPVILQSGSMTSTGATAGGISANIGSLGQLSSTQSAVTSTYSSLASISSINQVGNLPSQQGANRDGAMGDLQWSSDTELSTGHIPAFVASDEDMGIHSDATAIVDLQQMQNYALGQAIASATANGNRTSDNWPALLQGKVSRTVKAEHTNSTSSHDAKRLSLKHGTVLFAPANDTQIETPLGTISIAAKSMVLVMASRDSVSVFDIDDCRHNAVTIKAGDRQFALVPGAHALITRHMSGQFADINQARMIGYRNLREQAVSEDMRVFSTEFSIAHAIALVQPLKKMLNSDHPRARKLSNHMLKTMSILMSLPMRQNSYRQYYRPRLTACAK